MKDKRVAIYARVSTSDGKQDYSRQVDELKIILESHGFLNFDVYAEEISGHKKTDERLELQKLLNKIEDNPQYYARIYTSEISRIGRQPTETRKIIDRLTELGVPIYIQSLNDLTLKDGNRNMIMNIILQVLIEYANLESETFKTRSKSGLLKSAKSGRAGGGKYIPYGYKRDKDKMLVIDEEESLIIKRVFELYKKGNGIKVISNILNQDKIPTRTNKSFPNHTIKFKIPKETISIQWSDKQIHDILKNPIYKGKRRFKGITIESPEIISSDLFDECTEIMESKTHRNYTTTYTYLLKNLLVCGKCGRNYYAKYKPVKNGDKVYKCSSTLIKGHKCDNKGVNIKLIESVFFNEINDSDLVLKYLKNTQQLKKDIGNSIEILKHQIEDLKIKIDKKSSEKIRLLDVYLDSGIKKDVFLVKQREIDDSLQSTQERLKVLTKELRIKEKNLLSLDDDKPTKEMLFNSKNNRNELSMIFNQLIHKGIVNSINDKMMLVSIIISIGGEVIRPTLKILLDVGGIKRKPMVFRYKSMINMEFEPVYNENILITSLDDILNEFETTLLHEWIEIKPEFLIDIPLKNEEK